MEAVEVKVRLDRETRDEMGRIAGNLGMTANAAFSVFAHQFVAHRGFPFPVVERIPTKEEFTDEMEARLDEVRAGMCSIHELVDDEGTA